MKYTLDFEEYKTLARQTIAEGQVLVENKDNTLPIANGTKIAVFGRVQHYYYKSGTGSGGMVNVSKVVGILDALKECEETDNSVVIDNAVLKYYEDMLIKEPYKEADGWANGGWNVPEFVVPEDIIKKSAMDTDYAIYIIGRTAGEDQDNTNTEGSYLLTKEEKEMLKLLRDNYKKLIIVLNVGNIIDMSFVKAHSVDAVLYAWQGGMLGGYGTVDVLTGKVSPSGKLSDTIAADISDYPSNDNFGDPDEAIYAEDIFVGYRYFETFAKDKVLYPFGYGLTYSSFSIENNLLEKKSDRIVLEVTVKNVGEVKGKEVVQVYVKAPSGKLSKPARVLTKIYKTASLDKGGIERIHMEIPFSAFASFDENSRCGLGSGFVIEKGEYEVFAGFSVRADKAGAFTIEEDTLIEGLENALGPVKDFERLTQDGSYENVPKRKDTQKARRDANLPNELTITGDKGYKLIDVANGKVSIDEFIAQLELDELNALVRGEGMSSTLVTAGTASAFGGIIPSLKEKGIPIGCMDDGPSGMRLDSGLKAFSLPNGTLIACSFNPDLVRRLYAMLGLEMLKNKVDVLLGPGMNIHRHPLNGRNFEYFSEDPYLTGIMGSAEIAGLQENKVTGVIKHFACNNQETGRQKVDPVVSERALREIYLKGFEIAVKNGADAVMTTYCRINGVWTAGCYDLNTTILRNQWGFKGIVMTDWWAYISEENVEKSKTNFAGMLRAQNDLYMCVPGATENVGDNVLSSVADGTLTVGELQRTAKNVCLFLIKYAPFIRLTEDIDVEVTKAEEGYAEENVEVDYILIEDGTVIDLTNINCERGSKYYFGTELAEICDYEVSITGTGLPGNELAQLPVVFFSNATPLFTFTFRGNGEETTITNSSGFYNKRNIMYLYFSLGGVKLNKMIFRKKK